MEDTFERAKAAFIEGVQHSEAGRSAEAEACFREALAIARRQEARSWELRIATSLGRLLRTRGKRQEARSVVRAACDWFTEGRATADFQEATTLLRAL